MPSEFGYLPGVGGFILTTASTRKATPSAQKHTWDIPKPRRGQTATCVKCGCLKIHQLNYFTFYQAAGSSVKTLARPPCSGPTTKQ